MTLLSIFRKWKKFWMTLVKYPTTLWLDLNSVVVTWSQDLMLNLDCRDSEVFAWLWTNGRLGLLVVCRYIFILTNRRLGLPVFWRYIYIWTNGRLGVFQLSAGITVYLYMDHGRLGLPVVCRYIFIWTNGRLLLPVELFAGISLYGLMGD